MVQPLMQCSLLQKIKIHLFMMRSRQGQLKDTFKDVLNVLADITHIMRRFLRL